MEAAVVALVVKAYDEGTKVAGYINDKNDYVKDLEGNYLKLKRVVGTLMARRDDVEAEVNRDKRMQATRECQDWILRVKEIETEFSNLEKEYNRKVKRSWKPNRWFSKSKLSERIAKKSEEVRCQLAEGNFERGVVVTKLVKPVEKMGALNIEDKQSLHTVFQKTLSYLKHDKIRRIGIWGAVGIGKTAIMQYLNDNEGIAKMFDIIIWITMPKNPSNQELQKAIIQRLNFSVEGISSIKGKAQRISDELRGKEVFDSTG